MALHMIEPERRTLHGHFSPELPPVVAVDSGDTVRYRTLDAGWGLEPHTPGSPEERRKFPREPGTRDAGHALCGPVEVRGARPGMTLEVQIVEVRPGAWGWTWAGGWPSPLNQRLGVAEGEGRLLRWTLDPEAGTACDQHGHVVALRPFLGVMGMPPPEPGVHPTWPPRVWGGNLDCKELVAGSTLYLPVPVPGARFSVGDGHAAQGDGEVSSQGIECPMERVELRLALRDDLALRTPRAHTPAGWLTFGFDADLQEAAHRAVEEMLALLGEQHALERKDALALASVSVDLRVTQMVNGVCGVHALLPHGAIRRSA